MREGYSVFKVYCDDGISAYSTRRPALKELFKEVEKKYAVLNYDFQTVAWYHTLLSAKLQRALAGFHEPACDDEFALYDAVAQLEICKKAIS